MPTTTTMFSVIAALPLVAQASKVLVYTQPGLNGPGLGHCHDESQNLESIVMYAMENSPININGKDFDFSGFSVDNNLATFADPELASKLAASSFFFMVDMEGNPDGLTGLDLDNAYDFGYYYSYGDPPPPPPPTPPPTIPNDPALAIIKDYVAGGGVMLMTGTSGHKDATLLNHIFGWDTTSMRCVSGTKKNVKNTMGTVFAIGPEKTQCPNAADHLNCSSVPCVPYYGTAESNSVSVLPHGEGKVIFIGFDYFNAGMKTSKHTATCSDGKCGRCADGITEYQQILQLSLKHAAIEVGEATLPPELAPAPTPSPTDMPTANPTPAPTDLPTANPTPAPTDLPTETPCVPDFDEKKAIDLVFRMYKRNAGGDPKYHGAGDDKKETTKLLAGYGLDNKKGSRTLKTLAARTVRALRRSQGWVDEE